MACLKATKPRAPTLQKKRPFDKPSGGWVFDEETSRVQNRGSSLPRRISIPWRCGRTGPKLILLKVGVDQKAVSNLQLAIIITPIEKLMCIELHWVHRFPFKPERLGLFLGILST